MTSGTVGNSIEHPGVITEITSDTIKVSIVSVSACGSCHAQSTCSVSDKEIKTVDVPRHGQQFQVGENVNVVFQKSLGPLAILLGYVAPLIVLVIILTISWSVTNNEVKSGLFSIAGVAVYYSLLTLFRTKLKSTFLFTIQKG
jgi:sigma-E factor negative regulatory protein RseC